MARKLTDAEKINLIVEVACENSTTRDGTYLRTVLGDRRVIKAGIDYREVMRLYIGPKFTYEMAMRGTVNTPEWKNVVGEHKFSFYGAIQDDLSRQMGIPSSNMIIFVRHRGDFK